MADPVRPLRLGTVIWFGSLEFMSLGHEYDVVLLTPQAPPTDDDVTPQQPRRRRRPGRRSHHARQARHGRDHPDTTQAQGDAPRSIGIPRPAVGTRSLVGDLSSLSLDKGKTPVVCGDAPSSSSARHLLRSRLWQSKAWRWHHPRTWSPQDATNASPSTSAP